MSEFWDLVDTEFGRSRSRTLTRDHVLTELGNRTAEQALAAGVPARDVWFALCDDLDVPPERRFGPERPRERR
jgi:hypothetical protein